MLERFTRGEVLIQLAVGHAAQVLQAGELGRVDRNVDEGKRFVDAIERGFALLGRQFSLRQQAKQRGALSLLRDTLESGVHLGANDVPVLPFRGCLGREPMEREAFLGRERRVAQEVVQALRKTGCDDLERTDRWSDQSRLDLGDEPLGELLPGQLRLTHPALAAGGPNAFSKARCRRRFDGPHGAPL